MDDKFMEAMADLMVKVKSLDIENTTDVQQVLENQRILNVAVIGVLSLAKEHIDRLNERIASLRNALGHISITYGRVHNAEYCKNSADDAIKEDNECSNGQ